MKKDIYFFLGTAAELIKVFPIILGLKKYKKKFKLIFTGQNNLENFDLFKSLNLNDITIKISSKSIKQSVFSLFFWFIRTLFISHIKLRYEFKNLRKNESIIIIHGDTISTLIGAIVGKIFKLKVVHIEAGLRSFNFFKPFPEEICRFFVSFLTDVHFCPNEIALNNSTKRRGIKINTYLNTLIDSINLAPHYDNSTISKKIYNRKYYIFVLHRQENLYNYNLLKKLIKIVVGYSNEFICVFIQHKPTVEALRKARLLSILENMPNLVLTPRLNFFEFITLLKNCEFIVTDGGSNQEESYYLGKPCLILREFTERAEGLDENAVLSKNNQDIIKNFLLQYKNYKKDIVKNANSPSKIIVEFLNNY